MRRLISALLVVTLLSPSAAFAVDGKKAAYAGGTVAGIRQQAEGTFQTSDPERLRFDAGKHGGLEIPYKNITGLEYGQKAGRRVAVAVLISPLALFSKKRNHFLTVTYTDASGAEQAAVFELGKDIIRTSLKVLEVRSGREIEYQDEDARKSGLGGR